MFGFYDISGVQHFTGKVTYTMVCYATKKAHVCVIYVNYTLVVRDSFPVYGLRIFIGYKIKLR